MLTERLVSYDTSSVDGLRSAAGFVKGWLDARDIAVTDHAFDDLYVLTAEVGPADAPTLGAEQTVAGTTAATVVCGNVPTVNATVYVVDQVLTPAG